MKVGTKYIKTKDGEVLPLLADKMGQAEAGELSGEILLRLRYRKGQHEGTKFNVEENYPAPQKRS